jgi:uncharacterized membrane protein SirB2
MPYEFYKVLHVSGLLLAVGGLGAVAVQMIATGNRSFPLKRWIMAVHGLGTILVFVSGFGLMARTGLVSDGWPLWIKIKMGLWLLVLGLGPTLIMRIPRPGKWVWWALPGALIFAVMCAVYKTQIV